MYVNRRALLREYMISTLFPDTQGDPGQSKQGSGNLRDPGELFFLITFNSPG